MTPHSKRMLMNQSHGHCLHVEWGTVVRKEACIILWWASLIQKPHWITCNCLKCKQAAYLILLHKYAVAFSGSVACATIDWLCNKLKFRHPQFWLFTVTGCQMMASHEKWRTELQFQGLNLLSVFDTCTTLSVNLQFFHTVT